MRRLLLILALIVFPVMATAQTRPMTYEDILGLKRPADPQISPDGSRVAFVVSERDQKEDVYNEDLYVVAAPEGNLVRLTYAQKRDHHPRWSRAAHTDLMDNCEQLFDELAFWRYSEQQGQRVKIRSDGNSLRDSRRS